jgi:hypothetical protein
MPVYFGDIHNHCGLSYGHGTLNDALSNARLQLDFASVTVHAAWPDLPTDDPALGYLVDYHREGFVRAMQNWPAYLQAMADANDPGQFITLPSFEWHSLAYGDYCIYYQQEAGAEIINAPDISAMRAALEAHPTPTMMIPHHIGYQQGSRGINWAAFDAKLAPVAEIFSFHGSAFGSEGAYPYLHSMGPRDQRSTAQSGWEQGHVVGVVGSTDHHNAMPGSYGYGKLGVWADSLTRRDIWNAIQARRTYALTGDRIALDFSVNAVSMGGIAPADAAREIDVTVTGADAIDYIDILHNNQLVHRETVYPQTQAKGKYKLHIEVGWGELADPFDWDVHVQLENGALLDVEPRFRGHGPTDSPADDAIFAYSVLECTEDSVHFRTRTNRNPALHTPATEGVALEIHGDANTRLHLSINDSEHDIALADLLHGARSIYMGGFVSPALCLHRAIAEEAYQQRFTFVHRAQSTQRDWYTLRVRQHNNQYAWGSPVWVDAPSRTS